MADKSTDCNWNTQHSGHADTITTIAAHVFCFNTASNKVRKEIVSRGAFGVNCKRGIFAILSVINNARRISAIKWLFPTTAVLDIVWVSTTFAHSERRLLWSVDDTMQIHTNTHSNVFKRCFISHE
jgi:hypothetical protein